MEFLPLHVCHGLTERRRSRTLHICVISSSNRRASLSDKLFALSSKASDRDCRCSRDDWTWVVMG